MRGNMRDTYSRVYDRYFFREIKNFPDANEKVGREELLEKKLAKQFLAFRYLDIPRLIGGLSGHKISMNTSRLRFVRFQRTRHKLITFLLGGISNTS